MIQRLINYELKSLQRVFVKFNYNNKKFYKTLKKQRLNLKM